MGGECASELETSRYPSRLETRQFISGSLDKPGLDGEDVRGQVRVAVGDPVEPGLRPEHREPRRPGVRGNQVAAVAAGERDLKQVPRVEPEDRPPVRGEVPHPGERPR